MRVAVLSDWSFWLSRERAWPTKQQRTSKQKRAFHSNRCNTTSETADKGTQGTFFDRGFGLAKGCTRHDARLATCPTNLNSRWRCIRKKARKESRTLKGSKCKQCGFTESSRGCCPEENTNSLKIIAEPGKRLFFLKPLHPKSSFLCNQHSVRL